MNFLAAVTIVIAWCSFLYNTPQTPPVSEKQSASEFEKRAVAGIQRILASEIDAALPRLPFANWFRQVVGSEAGVVWQLSECAENASAPPNSTADIPACVEVNSILPDERRVIVLIIVGTFKRGMIGAPAFQLGVVEHNDELYTINQLRDLPKLLSAPERLAYRPAPRLPTVEIPKVKLGVNFNLAAVSAALGNGEINQSTTIEDPPPPPAPKSGPKSAPATSTAENQSLSGGVLRGAAVIKVQPIYPRNARRFNASGPVEVQITISTTGSVTNAKAISGHPLLRTAAVEAARQWVFKPSTINGAPVETQFVLTFEFTVPQN